ncbi:hypothetical protein H4I96_00676 [Botrytis cinerea]
MRFSLTRTCPISTSHSHFNSSFIGVISHVTSSPELQLVFHPQNTPFSSAQCANTQGTTISTLHVSILELTTSQPPSTAAKNANVQRAPRTIHCRARALPSMLMNADIITKPQKSLGGSTCHIRLYAP